MEEAEGGSISGAMSAKKEKVENSKWQLGETWKKLKVGQSVVLQRLQNIGKG